MSDQIPPPARFQVLLVANYRKAGRQAGRLAGWLAGWQAGRQAGKQASSQQPGSLRHAGHCRHLAETKDVTPTLADVAAVPLYLSRGMPR